MLASSPQVAQGRLLLRCRASETSLYTTQEASSSRHAIRLCGFFWQPSAQHGDLGPRSGHGCFLFFENDYSEVLCTRPSRKNTSHATGRKLNEHRRIAKTNQRRRVKLKGPGPAKLGPVTKALPYLASPQPLNDCTSSLTSQTDGLKQFIPRQCD